MAVGETGLDYLHGTEPETQARQREAFDLQLALGVKHQLPTIIHTGRPAHLRAAARPPGALVSCIVLPNHGPWPNRLDLGFYISISGIVTFKNADNVRDVASRVPSDRLLVETDAPWLAPVPKRGKTNEPAFVAHTAAFLAELRQTSVQSLCQQTSDNFIRLFGCGA